jgi:hypothetical protein
VVWNFCFEAVYQVGHAGFEQGEDAGELGVAAVVGVGDLGPAQVADLAEQPDPVFLARAREGAQVAEVAGVHGEHEVAFGQPGAVELAGAVGVAVVAVAVELAAGGAVHPLAHVPVAGAGAVHDHPLVEAGRGDLGPEHGVGHRRTADVPEADAADPVRPGRVARRRQRLGGKRRRRG